MIPGLAAAITKGKETTTPSTFRETIAGSQSKAPGENLGQEAHSAASLWKQSTARSLIQKGPLGVP